MKNLLVRPQRDRGLLLITEVTPPRGCLTGKSLNGSKWMYRNEMLFYFKLFCGLRKWFLLPEPREPVLKNHLLKTHKAVTVI
jgi:hypothetical protein